MAVFMVPQNQVSRLIPNNKPAVILVLGLFAVFLIQLVLSMVLTQDAYELNALKGEKRELATQVQILQEEVDSLASPQNLADAANRLGMVANPASVLLDLKKDRVYGSPKPADPGTSPVASANLVANSALVVTSDVSLSTVASVEVEAGVETSGSVSSELALESVLIPASPTR